MWQWRPALFPRSYNQLHVWSRETSPGHPCSHLSCNNKCFCLITINVRRRGIWSVGSPLLLALEKAPLGRERRFLAAQKSLFSFVGSSYTQQTAVWINKTGGTHLGDLWVGSQILASSYREGEKSLLFSRSTDEETTLQLCSRFCFPVE